MGLWQEIRQIAACEHTKAVPILSDREKGFQQVHRGPENKPPTYE